MESEKEKLEKLREIIGEILYGINSDFKYRGHGYNLGMWSTSDEDELKWAALEKPNELNCNTVIKKVYIRIKESQLEKVIKNTLKRILREH